MANKPTRRQVDATTEKSVLHGYHSHPPLLAEQERCVCKGDEEPCEARRKFSDDCGDTYSFRGL